MSENVTNYLPAVRWDMLRVINNAGHLGATEPMFLQVLRSFYWFVDQKLIRNQIHYLEERRLITSERSEINPWNVHMTNHGHDVYEYRVECHAGIARPRRSWSAEDGPAV